MNGDDTGSPGFPGLPKPAPRAPPFNIRATGRELFGEQWQWPLSVLLGIHIRTVQRWASGQTPVPPAIAQHILDLLAIARRCRAEADALRRGDAP